MKSMSCKKCVSMADAYLDEALPQKDRQKVEAHLALCPECRTRFFEQKQLLSLLRSCAVSPPQDFRARVMERIERESTAPKRPRAILHCFAPDLLGKPKRPNGKAFPLPRRCCMHCRSDCCNQRYRCYDSQCAEAS